MLHNLDAALASERVLYCSKLHSAGVTAQEVRQEHVHLMHLSTCPACFVKSTVHCKVTCLMRETLWEGFKNVKNFTNVKVY